MRRLLGCTSVGSRVTIAVRNHIEFLTRADYATSTEYSLIIVGHNVGLAQCV